jgi:hypothetical protein
MKNYYTISHLLGTGNDLKFEDDYLTEVKEYQSAKRQITAGEKPGVNVKRAQTQVEAASPPKQKEAERSFNELFKAIQTNNDSEKKAAIEARRNSKMTRQIKEDREAMDNEFPVYLDKIKELKREILSTLIERSSMLDVMDRVSKRIEAQDPKMLNESEADCIQTIGGLATYYDTILPKLCHLAAPEMLYHKPRTATDYFDSCIKSEAESQRQRRSTVQSEARVSGQVEGRGEFTMEEQQQQASGKKSEISGAKSGEKKKEGEDAEVQDEEEEQPRSRGKQRLGDLIEKVQASPEMSDLQEVSKVAKQSQKRDFLSKNVVKEDEESGKASAGSDYEDQFERVRDEAKEKREVSKKKKRRNRRRKQKSRGEVAIREARRRATTNIVPESDNSAIYYSSREDDESDMQIDNESPQKRMKMSRTLSEDLANNLQDQEVERREPEGEAPLQEVVRPSNVLIDTEEDYRRLPRRTDELQNLVRQYPAAEEYERANVRRSQLESLSKPDPKHVSTPDRPDRDSSERSRSRRSSSQRGSNRQTKFLHTPEGLSGRNTSAKRAHQEQEQIDTIMKNVRQLILAKGEEKRASPEVPRFENEKNDAISLHGDEEEVVVRDGAGLEEDSEGDPHRAFERMRMTAKDINKQDKNKAKETRPLFSDGYTGTAQRKSGSSLPRSKRHPAEEEYNEIEAIEEDNHDTYPNKISTQKEIAYRSIELLDREKVERDRKAIREKELQELEERRTSRSRESNVIEWRKHKNMTGSLNVQNPRAGASTSTGVSIPRLNLGNTNTQNGGLLSDRKLLSSRTEQARANSSRASESKPRRFESRNEDPEVYTYQIIPASDSKNQDPVSSSKKNSKQSGIAATSALMDLQNKWQTRRQNNKNKRSDVMEEKSNAQDDELQPVESINILPVQFENDSHSHRRPASNLRNERDDGRYESFGSSMQPVYQNNAQSHQASTGTAKDRNHSRKKSSKHAESQQHVDSNSQVHRGHSSKHSKDLHHPEGKLSKNSSSRNILGQGSKNAMTDAHHDRKFSPDDKDKGIPSDLPPIIKNIDSSRYENLIYTTHKRRMYIALKDFRALDKNYYSLRQGDVLCCVATVKGWYFVYREENPKKFGFCPGNYLNIIN